MYCIYTNSRSQTLTHKTETLEEAIKWCDNKKTKYGHSVIFSDGTIFNKKQVYRTYGNK